MDPSTAVEHGKPRGSKIALLAWPVQPKFGVSLVGMTTTARKLPLVKIFTYPPTILISLTAYAGMRLPDVRPNVVLSDLSSSTGGRSSTYNKCDVDWHAVPHKSEGSKRYGWILTDQHTHRPRLTSDDHNCRQNMAADTTYLPKISHTHSLRLASKDIADNAGTESQVFRWVFIFGKRRITDSPPRILLVRSGPDALRTVRTSVVRNLLLWEIAVTFFLQSQQPKASRQSIDTYKWNAYFQDVFRYIICQCSCTHKWKKHVLWQMANSFTSSDHSKLRTAIVFLEDSFLANTKTGKCKGRKKSGGCEKYSLYIDWSHRNMTTLDSDQ